MTAVRYLVTALYVVLTQRPGLETRGQSANAKLPQVMSTNTVTRQGEQGLLPGYVADKLLIVHHDTKLAGPGRKHVQRLWEQGELLSRGRSQDNGSPSCLGHTILTSLCTGQPQSQLLPPTG